MNKIRDKIVSRMKSQIWLVCALSVALTGFVLANDRAPGAQAQFHALPSQIGDRTCGGGGIDVPTPFQCVPAVKFELAEGEVYHLIGTVVFMAQSEHSKRKPYLKLNLAAQPWLASTKRVHFPYYQLEGNPHLWKNRMGLEVEQAFKAHGHIVPTENGHEYVISLIAFCS